MNDPKFPKLFLQSCRVGFYFRVLEEGEVGAGDSFQLLKEDSEGMTVREICRLYYFDPKNVEDCKRAIRIQALSPGWREGFVDRLEKAGIEIGRKGEPADEMCCDP